MIERGLIVEQKWLALILSGEKTWEIRRGVRKNVMRIALADRTAGVLVGTCMIAESIPISLSELHKHFEKHRLSESDLRAGFFGPLVFAWPLSDAKALSPPIAYDHPSTGVWITLAEGNVEEFQRLQSN